MIKNGKGFKLGDANNYKIFKFSYMLYVCIKTLKFILSHLNLFPGFKTIHNYIPVMRIP